jgi:hypothetical protein
MNPNDPTPVTPSAPAQPVTQPITQLTSVPQPASSATVTNGMAPQTSERLAKQKKLAYALSIVSIVIFVVALASGYTFAFAALLAAYGLMVGIRTKTVPLIVVAAIGLVLNFGVYTISVFSSL